VRQRGAAQESREERWRQIERGEEAAADREERERR